MVFILQGMTEGRQPNFQSALVIRAEKAQNPAYNPPQSCYFILPRPQVAKCQRYRVRFKYCKILQVSIPTTMPISRFRASAHNSEHVHIFPGTGWCTEWRELMLETGRLTRAGCHAYWQDSKSAHWWVILTVCGQKNSGDMPRLRSFLATATTSTNFVIRTAKD